MDSLEWSALNTALREQHKLEARVQKLEEGIRFLLEDHACATGDCPHQKSRECLNDLRAELRALLEEKA